ncbi:MAG: hypothetical protein ACXACE_15225 [Candidatus Thorarchaeota archaeon]|jgi:hypothetical protein
MSFAGDKLLGVRFDSEQVQTSAQISSDGLLHDLGTVVQTADGKEYVYIQANGAISANDVIGFGTAAAPYDLAPLAAAGLAFAVSPNAIADNGAGWVQTKGIVSAAADVNTAAGELLARLTNGSGQLVDVVAPGVADGDASGFAVALEADTANVASVYIL